MDYYDDSLERPMHLVLDQIGVDLQNVTTAKGVAMPLDFSMRWNGFGTLEGNGTVSMSPVAADFNLALAHIELRPIDPYLDKFVDLLITDGEFGLKGHVNAAMPTNAPMQISFEGDVQLNKFAMEEIDEILSHHRN